MALDGRGGLADVSSDKTGKFTDSNQRSTAQQEQMHTSCDLVIEVAETLSSLRVK